MTNPNLTSPAGDSIAVFDDEDFAELLGVPYPSRTYTQSLKQTPARAAVLRKLWTDGAVYDKSGRAIRLLPGDATPVLAQAPMRLCVERALNGKRTYSAQLVALPERWLVDLGVESTVEPEPVANLAELPPASEPEPDLVASPGQDLGSGSELEQPFELAPEISAAVASALLSQLVGALLERATATPELERVTKERQDLIERLGHQVGYVERLRRELRETSDELIAAKHERDGLRQRVGEVERNLRAALSSDAKSIIDHEVRRQLAAVMRQAPNGQHGPDNF